MILLDANILLYAFDDRSPHHIGARHWLEALLSGEEAIGIPWLTAWAFVKISTNPRLNHAALGADQALAVLDELLANPLVTIVNPGRNHTKLLLEQMRSGQVRGADTTDAVLAAMAIEIGARFASADVGFRRFAKLDWVNPLDAGNQ